LAAAEDPRHNSFTQQQIQTFAKLAGKVEKWMGQPVLKHILNTAGIQHHPEGQFDMVRLGLGLYGVSPVPEESNRLRPVARLTTAISQIKHLEPGDSVGYGRSFTAPSPMRSATLPIGYADGFDRRLSNGKGRVFIHGQPAPVLGRVCMDMIMVDVTHIECQEGDTAEIFGHHQSIAQLAEAMETIPYEVLTGLSSRIKRVYYRE
jgi:alanine racemase